MPTEGPSAEVKESLVGYWIVEDEEQAPQIASEVVGCTGYPMDLRWFMASSYSKDKVPQFFAKMTDVYGGTLQAEIASTVAERDHVIVLTRESCTVHRTPVAWTGVHIWSFDQGLATRFVSYGSARNTSGSG